MAFTVSTAPMEGDYSVEFLTFKWHVLAVKAKEELSACTSVYWHHCQFKWCLSVHRKIFPGKVELTHFIIFLFLPLTKFSLLRLHTNVGQKIALALNILPAMTYHSRWKNEMKSYFQAIKEEPVGLKIDKQKAAIAAAASKSKASASSFAQSWHAVICVVKE